MYRRIGYIWSYNCTGTEVSNHFRGVTKMIEIGKGGKRKVAELEKNQNRGDQILPYDGRRTIHHSPR